MNMSRIIELALETANNNIESVFSTQDDISKAISEVEFLTKLRGKIGLGLVKEVNTEDLGFDEVLERVKIVSRSMRCTDEVLQLSVIKDEETKEYKTFITYR